MTVKLLLTLKTAAGVAVCAVGGGAGGAGSKDEAVGPVLQEGGPGAGRGLLTHLFAVLLACEIVKKKRG